MTSGKIIGASWMGTAALALTALPALAVDALDPVAVAVAVILFVGGAVTFLWALARAADRSRRDAIGMGGLFFLQGSSTPAARRHLLSSLALQVLIGFGAASARPFTASAFGVLTPMFGLALCGLWAAHFGQFEPRVDTSGR